MTEHGKDASQRAELKERIIATATEAFTTKGIKSITMDDIAAALGISKRTLYDVFVDKESLLNHVLFYGGSGARHFPFGCQLCNRQFAGTRAVRCAVEYGCMQRIFLYRGV